MNKASHADLYPPIMEKFADVVQKTVMTNSVERFKGRYHLQEPLIDVEKCLLLFERVALGVLIEEEVAKRYVHLFTLPLDLGY